MKRYHSAVVVLFAVLLSVRAGADTTTLRLSFEKSLDADVSSGEPEGIARGAVSRVPDRFGTSLLLGPGEAVVSYAAKGNINLERGTLIAWLQPDGWKSEMTKPVTLLRVRQGNAWMTLMWRPADVSLILLRQQGDGKTSVASKPAYDWVQTAAHHVAFTWAPGALAMFVDGQPAQPVKVADLKPMISVPRSEGLEIGGDFGASATLAIRSITIMAEPVSTENLRARYRASVTGHVAHERPSLTLAPCQRPPEVDGKLNENEWDMAAGVSGFVEIGSGTLSSVATRAYMTYDSRNIYLAFRSPFSGNLPGGKYDRDAGAPWDDDCVEAFLQPEVGFTGKFYHLIINSHGSLWDAEDNNAAWNGVSQWASARRDDEWIAEVAVPFTSLGTLPPNDKSTWQANFCRSIGSGGTKFRHTAWAFTAGSGYAAWQYFGSVRFNAATATAQFESLTAQPSAGVEGKLRLSNATGKAARASLRTILYRAQMADECEEITSGPWDLRPGETKQVPVRLVPSFPIDQVKFVVQDVESERVLLSQMVRAGALVPTEPTVVPPSLLAVTSATVAPTLTNELLGQVIRERGVWQDNRLGITDKVPPPWTAMHVSDKRVSCWGRVYDYTNSLFPARVQSQGAEILSAPVALTAKAAGKLVAFQKADKQSVVPASHQVDVDCLASAAGLNVRVRSHMEYDGCIKVELSLTPKDKPVLLDALELRIPVKPERALYYHWFEATRDPRLTNAGGLPKEGLKGHFKPLLWLGDDDRGFCWFCESPKGWQNTDKESVHLVERQTSATVMRIRMVDRPYVVAGEWKVVFGLMATPTRPMPPGWRDWLIPLNQSNPFSSWAPGFNNISGTDDPGTLTPRDPEKMKQWVQQVRENGAAVPYLSMREPMKVIPYSQIVFWSGKHRDGMPSPEIKVFGPEWSNRSQPPGPRREPDEHIPLKEYYWVCPASSFAQFYMYRLNQLIDQTDIDGIYIDGPWNICSNPLHGCGYMDDKGQWQNEFKIWPYRELLKRIYCLFYEKRKDPIIHHHTSCWLCIPSISFSHMMLDGEQYHDAGQKVEDHFMDIVPLDKWRAEHTGRQWGPAPFLLPDIPGQWCAPAAPTRELLMLTNLHDTALFPAGCNWRLVMRNYQARRMFGVADCEFRGYWGNSDWVRCETPNAYVSIYRKPDGSRCLCVVGNTSKSDATVVVQPNFSGLKLTSDNIASGVDLETGERISLAKGVMTLPVKARDFRLVALPFYEAPPITAGDMRASAVREIPNPGFENGLARWTGIPIEGNAGYIREDKETRFAGSYSCHLHKAEGPGGVMIQTDDIFLVEQGKKYRANCQVKIANSTGAQAYWMISAMDREGNSVLSNNLFHGFIKENQDWKPLPFEFACPPGAVVVRLHFLVAFPGVADVWVDDFRLEEIK